MKQKSSTIELVTQSETKKFNYRVSNSKVKQKSSTIELVTQSEFLLVFDFELGTWSVIFYFLTTS